MAILVNDRDLEKRLKAERKATGADRYDEVWEGVYRIMPLAGDEHQYIVTGLSTVFTVTIQWPGLGQVRSGVNVSDRSKNWKYNYRIPDVAVFLKGTKARNCETHWVGGPDFAVEIASPGDDTREKLPFYGAVGTRELLLIDRDPWALELHRLHEGQLVRQGTSQEATGEWLVSTVLPLRFRLVADADAGGDGRSSRPRIEVMQTDGPGRWLL
jgi:Uma2 family endonuclease